MTSSTRVRTDAPLKSFSDLDAATADLRVIENQKRKFLLPLLHGESPAIDLTPGSSRCSVQFGLRTDGLFEKPSFISGEAADPKAREGLSMVVRPNEALRDFLQKVDAAFESKFRATGGRGDWQPLIAKRGALDAECFKVKVILAGARGLTDILVKNPDSGAISQGSGWAFAQPLLEEFWGFKGAKLKLSVRFHSVWSVSGRSGLTLHAAFAAFQPAAPKVEKNPYLENLDFGDESE